ncbi:hypothetical protein JOB18_008596 [Solea senegalensis]|uniref:Uncharacterized protein n=1 Tax=Solea senegalensis TaxID=28829 RepID=A0AAV6SK70_SOLSE|nr:hypothetical protein JOB18_008596 [Solea senegalensis]
MNRVVSSAYSRETTLPRCVFVISLSVAALQTESRHIVNMLSLIGEVCGHRKSTSVSLLSASQRQGVVRNSEKSPHCHVVYFCVPQRYKSDTSYSRAHSVSVLPLNNRLGVSPLIENAAKEYELMCVCNFEQPTPPPPPPPPVLEDKNKHYLHSEAFIHNFVNGIGIVPALILAASDHLSRAGHFTRQVVCGSGTLETWTGFTEKRHWSF